MMLKVKKAPVEEVEATPEEEDEIKAVLFSRPSPSPTELKEFSELDSVVCENEELNDAETRKNGEIEDKSNNDDEESNSQVDKSDTSVEELMESKSPVKDPPNVSNNNEDEVGSSEEVKEEDFKVEQSEDLFDSCIENNLEPPTDIVEPVSQNIPEDDTLVVSPSKSVVPSASHKSNNNPEESNDSVEVSSTSQEGEESSSKCSLEDLIKTPVKERMSLVSEVSAEERTCLLRELTMHVRDCMSLVELLGIATQ